MSVFHSQTLCVKYEHIIILAEENSNTIFLIFLDIIGLINGFQFPESIDLYDIFLLTFPHFYIVMLLAEYQRHFCCR